MILEAGKGSYKLPPIGRLQLVSVDTGDESGAVVYMMTQVDLRDIISMRQNETSYGREAVLGVPAYFALRPTADFLEIWPLPAGPYRCTVRYFPPIKEL